jgi:hypothetical protein
LASIYQTTWRRIPEDLDLGTHCRENIRTRINKMYETQTSVNYHVHKRPSRDPTLSQFNLVTCSLPSSVRQS